MVFQDGVYYRLGQLIAMALIHGGAPVHILCPSVFTFLSGMKPCDIVVTIEEVPDARVRDILWKALQLVCSVTVGISIVYLSLDPICGQH